MASGSTSPALVPSWIVDPDQGYAGIVWATALVRQLIDSGIVPGVMATLALQGRRPRVTGNPLARRSHGWRMMTAMSHGSYDRDFHWLLPHGGRLLLP